MGTKFNSPHRWPARRSLLLDPHAFSRPQLYHGGSGTGESDRAVRTFLTERSYLPYSRYAGAYFRTAESGPGLVGAGWMSAKGPQFELPVASS